MGKWFSFKKYEWFDKKLQRQYNKNNNIVYVLAILALASLYLLPGNFKVVSMIVMVIGAVFIFKNNGIQNKDREIRKINQQKLKEQEIKTE